MKLSKEQKNILYRIVREVRNGTKQQTLGGYAGVGKSFLINYLRQFFPKFCVCAYTGKAANVLRTKGVEDASTIHSRIYKPFFENGVIYWDLNPEPGCDGFIVDEACLPYRQRVQTENGPLEIGKIVNQQKECKVFSYNFQNGQIELKKINNWFRYRRRNTILEIKVSQKQNREMQKTIRCTPNHKFYLRDGTKVPANVLKVGDVLLVRGKFFNNEQRSFLMGSLLGDTSISKSTKHTAQINFRHGECQKKYLDFKKRLFSESSLPRPYPSGYSKHRMTWAFSPHCTDDLDKVYNITHESGKKIVTDNWLDQIDDIGLAAWYMDDGHLETHQGGPNVHLHTEGFSEKENQLIKQWMQKKYGFYVGVYRTGKYYKLRLDRKSSHKFLQLVAPWFCLDMLYKLPKELRSQKEKYSFSNYKDHGELPVISINEWKPKCVGNYVYDIEIEDNHNYFANNVLVSNSMVSKEIYKDLKSFGFPMVFVGDHGQLEPIGSDFNLMGKPDYTLEEIHRNAGNITHFAEHVRKGFAPRGFKGDDSVEFLGRVRVDDYVQADQIICAYNKTRVKINTEVRRAMGYEGVLNVGERIMCLRNNRRANLFNGMQGVVIDLYSGKRGDKYMDFLFDGKVMKDIKYSTKYFGEESYDIKFGGGDSPNPFDYAYCITAHKSQGDEWNEVLVIEQRCRNWDHKRWAYTAASRPRVKLRWKLAT